MHGSDAAAVTEQNKGTSSKEDYDMTFLKSIFTATMAAIAVFVLTGPGTAQELDLTKESTYDQILEWANEPLDTSEYKKDGKLKIGVSAGYLSNAWINFTAQMIKYEASLHPEIEEIKITDAGFNPTKQAADIDDLLTSGVDAILFWPVDEKAIMPARQPTTMR